ncbi:MarR family transcriptional regulator [Clostridium sp. YIM B02505]|uniref:MarR family transcriptional regulator n=1 Tax=Clostridium yunnanense TaxID=2800325 RepID=A0ABS1ENV4_9CLOT|nr:MarR family transcriptional regulator [Clostridium yunnanense]MBK1811118.1 MarR family transcriptional regulator [Clostridium yunnanense]
MDKQIYDEMIENLYWAFPLLKTKLVKPFDKEEKASDLTGTHMTILFMVKEKGSICISEIGKHLGICKANLTPLIQKLIDKSYIERFVDDKDRRYTYIKLTSVGEDFMENKRYKVQEFLKEKVSDLSEADLMKLSASVAGLKEVLMKIK